MSTPTEPSASTTAEGSPVSGAWLRVTREHLGLTTRWIADTLDINERSVHRWEDGTNRIPDGIADRVREWVATTDRIVDDLLDQLEDPAAPRTFTTYRTDAAFKAARPALDWPASWHRAIAARILDQHPDLAVDWA